MLCSAEGARSRRRPRRDPRARRGHRARRRRPRACSASTTSVFDLSITPNRPDAMSIVGVARELAAHFGLPLDRARAGVAEARARRRPQVTGHDRGPRPLPALHRGRRDGHDGPVAGVDAAAARARRACGRSRTSSTSPTTCCSSATSRCTRSTSIASPGRGIVVRLAGDGERMTTLDGVERALDASDLLICDGERRPQAIAGIMGGGDSEVSDATTAILLEAAYFEPMGISRSSKRLEAALGVERALRARHRSRTASRPAARARWSCSSRSPAPRSSPELVDEYPVPVTPAAHPRAHRRRSNGVLGDRSSPTREVHDALRPLGIEVDRARATTSRRSRRRSGPTSSARSTSSRRWPVGSASTRSAARCPNPSTRSAASPVASSERRLAADVLVGVGLSEAVTIPLVSPEAGGSASAPTTAGRQVANPLRAEESVLRPSLLPGLAAAAAYNVAPAAAATSRCSRSATCSCAPTAVERPAPTRSKPSRVCSPARARASADRARSSGRRVRRGGDWCARSPTRWASASCGSCPRSVPGLDPKASAPRVAGDDGCRGRRRRSRRARPRHRARRGRRSRSSSTSTRCGRGTACRPAVPAAVVVPAVDHRPRVRRAATTCGPRRSMATLRDAGGELLEAVRCFDEFRGERSGRGGAASRSRCGSGRPTARSPTSRSRTCANAAIDAVVAAHGAELRT